MREVSVAIASSFKSRRRAFSGVFASLARMKAPDKLPAHGDYNDNEMVTTAVMTDNKMLQKCNNLKQAAQEKAQRG